MLDRIQVRGVGRMGLEWNSVRFKERPHEFGSVYLGIILLEKRIS